MIVPRTLSKQFLADFEGGPLRPILDRIHKDDTLMLGLRGSYVNVYYRGGSLLRLEAVGTAYKGTIDPQYVKSKPLATEFLFEKCDHSAEWAAWVPEYKAAMDSYFATTKSAAEREFQQLVAWENNRSPIANETEYFITDIEFATDIHADGKIKKARIDMLGVRWQSNDHAKGKLLAPVLIEMKYGNGALDGKSGLSEHLKDISNLLESKSNSIAKMIETQFDQLRQLDLIKCKQKAPQQLTGKPEVILLLANYNPRSSALATILTDLKRSYVQSNDFDLSFFVSGFAGYGMHRMNMLGRDEFEAYARIMSNPTERAKTFLNRA